MNDVKEDILLPALREDLDLIEGPVELDGSPSWLIFDPIRNKFFSIGWAAFQLLSRWNIGRASLLLEKTSQELALDVQIDDVKSLLTFLYGNSLTISSASGSSDDYYKQYKASKPNFLKWLVHNYLFLKIPLVKPTTFLKKTLFLAESFYSKTMSGFIIFLGTIGLYIVGRQWDSYVATFLYFFNLQGLMFYFISLIGVKVLHELGHAYTSVRCGCKIPTMGIVFLVMYPMLYTDTSDTWRVKSAKDRIHIGAAGMIVELYVACIATFLWAFLPEGVLKSAAFILATTSWVMSILINTNILMRFDGYYIFSDILGIQNLQKRSFDVGKWRLTELLFSLKLAPPEALPKSMLRKLYIYAWAVWVYRFFLFIGIALLVYYFFFKLLGLALFLVEILWFIIIPVLKFFKKWWKIRKMIIKSVRFYITLCVFSGLIFVFIYPWSTSIVIPAIYKSQNKATIYSPEAAYIEKKYVKIGDHVEKDDILLLLKSPEIENDIKLTEHSVNILKLQTQRVAANNEDLSNIQVLVSEIQEKKSELIGLKERQEKLIIRAPISGVVYELENSLHNGRWINQTLSIATIIEPDKASIEGVLSEYDLDRIKIHAKAKFIPDDPSVNSIWGFVHQIGQANLKVLDIHEISSIYGGMVPVKESNNTLFPDKSVYRVNFKISPVEKVKVNQVMRGVVHVEGVAESFFTKFYSLIVSVLVRESGF